MAARPKRKSAAAPTLAEENAEQRRLTAWAIKTAREYRGMKKEEFARELTKATGLAWSENMISKLETGGKVVSLKLLTIIREIQQMPLEWYFSGPKAMESGSISQWH